MDVGLMVEGQHGLNWENWRRILALADRLRFPTVFRSDHYFMLPTHQQDSPRPLSLVHAGGGRDGAHPIRATGDADSRSATR